jgi:DNA-binding winged helix-turn-helix (wHTH) protein
LKARTQFSGNEIEQTCSAPSKAVQELLATTVYIGHRACRGLHARGGEAMQLQWIRRDNSSIEGSRARLAVAGATLGFGRFRVHPRRRQLLADGVAIEIGTRAFDLLLALLEADGSLVTKDELLSRVWPDVFVGEENLKVQVSALRKALGEDRDFIRTEFGRGYRFTAEVRSTAAWNACPRSTRQKHASDAKAFRLYIRKVHVR